MRTLRSLMMLLIMAGLVLTGRASAAEKADVSKLLATLADKTSETARNEALRTLARVGTPEAIPALVSLLEDEALSTLARGALEAMPGREAGAALRQQLEKSQGRALIGVIASLGSRKERESIDPLKKLLKHQDDAVAAAAAGALAKYGNESLAIALMNTLDTAPAARKGPLADALLVCAQSLEARRQPLGARVIYDHLRAADLPEYVKRAATLGAIKTRGEAGVPLAAECLASNDWMQFGLGLQSARLISGPAMTKAMLEALAKAPAEKQALLIKALGDRKGTNLLRAMKSAARKGDPAARAEAIRVIGRLGGPADVPLLFDLAAAPEAPVAEAAKAVLTGLPGAEVDKAVAEKIEAQDAAMRLLALDLTGKRAIKTATAKLLDLATADPDRKVRQAALGALGDGGGMEEMEALLGMMMKAKAEDLGSLEATVRSIATRLGDPPAAAGRLLAKLPGAPAPQKAALLRLAGAQGTPEALQAVQAALKDADAKVQDAAFRALCDWPNPEAADELLKLAESADTQPRRVLALRGVIRLTNNKRLEGGRRLAMLKQAAALAQGNGEKRQLLSALQTVIHPATLNLVVPHLDNQEIKADAAQAAVTIAEKLTGARVVRSAGTDAIAKAMEKVMAGAEDQAVKARAKVVLDRVNAAPMQ